MPIGGSLCLPLGGGPDDQDVEQQALLAALDNDLDPTAPEQIALTFGEALAIANMWAINRRLRGQLDPNRMVETLATWEQACDLRPAPTDTDVARRAALATRFRGFAGNDISQISDAAATLCGPSFVRIAVAGATNTAYLAGLMPGPPSMTTTNVRSLISVQLAPAGQPDVALRDLIRRLQLELQILCPAWLGFVVGTLDDAGSSGFVASQCTIGLSIL